MRIVYLSTADIPSRTANSIHIMKMCAAFAQNGHKVTLFAPKKKDFVLHEDNIFDYYGVPDTFSIRRIVYPSFNYGNYVYSILVVSKLLRFKTDLIYSRNFLCAFFASLLRIPQILEIHQPIPKSSRLHHKLFNWLIKQASFKLLVVITIPLKQIYLSKYPISKEKIFVAADGADLPKPDVKQSHKKVDRLQVGYIGHLYPGRGIELILDIAMKCVWADFHIVGGTENDIERVKKLSNSIENVNIHDFVTPSKAESFRAEADILLAPYQEKVGLSSGNLTTETWMSPLKIFEYMAAGKAIISSDLPVLHEVLEDGKNCILCPPNNLSAWITALEKLRFDRELRVTLGNAALNDLKTKYKWSIRATRILHARNSNK